MRYLDKYIKQDLAKKMVFLGGPRQVGKTTLSKEIIKSSGSSGLYLNWDSVTDQKKILNGDWFDNNKLIVFDEIHKYPKWKNLVKGFYDTQNEKHQFLITGSARLNVYRRGGDSLLGRYHHWELHPFTLDEKSHIPKLTQHEIFTRLMNVGGFPEPFFDNDTRESRRWREERFEKILKDDIRDLEGIRNIQQMGLLLELLRERVGSEIVVSNLAEDIQVTSPTILKWIEVFERMYLVFSVRPYTKKIARAVHKPFKIYFYDNADVIGDEGSRIENLVATHLKKRCAFLQDYTGEKHEIFFIRDREKREVDFLYTVDGRLQDLIEVKYKEKKISPSLLYMAEILKPARVIQLCGETKDPLKRGQLHLMGITEYFSKSVW